MLKKIVEITRSLCKTFREKTTMILESSSDSFIFNILLTSLEVSAISSAHLAE